MLIPTQNTNAKRKNAKSLQTHCHYGHPFDEVNTYISPKSRKRKCLACEKARKREIFLQDPEGNRKKNTEHMREWRKANPDRNKASYMRLRKQKREWLNAQKAACANCLESDPCVLDFHHKDPAEKEIEVASAFNSWSKARILEEIGKCLILCANCHRKLHASKRNPS